MPSISLNTATSITGLTKRTLWRHIHRGSLVAINANESGEKTQVRLIDIVPLACLPLSDIEQKIIIAADAGDAVAQTDLALLFFTAARPADAVLWLSRAAEQHYPDAMCYLGRCYLTGTGVTASADTGAVWLSHAAIKGHPLAQALTQWLQSAAGQTVQAMADQAILDAALDQIERETLLRWLHSAAAH
jgi:uncharacterized protein